MTNTKLQSNIIHNIKQLRKLGWNDYFADQLTQIENSKTSVARIISVQRKFLTVSDGVDEWLCTPAGKLIHNPNILFPVTGDWVLVEDSVIKQVIPRKNLLSRAESGSRGNKNQISRHEQPIAANIETVFIVCGLDRDFNIRRLERYLTLVYNCGLTPVIVLTKSDLCDEPEAYRTEVENVAFGVHIVLSAINDEYGKNELTGYIEYGHTTTMIGSSGAGKSTLANMLYGDDLLSTGSVSDSVGKGCHTTTSRELICMPQGGMLIDNPGIREIAFHEDSHGIENSFSDIEKLADSCRFADCLHQTEPGCAVLGAVQAGDIPSDRLESYHKMKREMLYLSDRRTKSADRIEKERWQDVAIKIKEINKAKK